MRFEEANGGWQESQLSQEKAARLPGVCERTFRRYVDRCEDEGLDGLVRLVQASARRAPEVVRAEAPYRERYDGWNVKHSFYRHRHEHRPSDCAVSFFVSCPSGRHPALRSDRTREGVVRMVDRQNKRGYQVAALQAWRRAGLEWNPRLQQFRAGSFTVSRAQMRSKRNSGPLSRSFEQRKGLLRKYRSAQTLCGHRPTYGHREAVAMRAPSARASSFAQTMAG